MRNLKKFLALVLAMMMALSLMVTANAQNAKKEYQDVADAEFTEAIDVLTGMGVFKGSDGDFRPTETITRAEAAAVLYRLVTGDVEDKRVELYAPQAYQFSDVTPGAWYAGYVGYAVDAGFVKGYNGEFMPSKKVTGYEMLAMLLRAVGYGKNGEFTGDSWRINVGATAQSLDILETIESSHYGNTLNHDSAREVVAELAFVTAKDVPTVTWTMLGGYNQYKSLLADADEKNLNPTLGEREFGLTNKTGIIVGNQETGEGNTILNIDEEYLREAAGEPSPDAEDGEGDEAEAPAEPTIELSIKTGLGLYGHKVEAWYKADTKTTYAVIDLAKAETVYSAEATAVNISKDAKLEAAGEDKVWWSEQYGVFANDAPTGDGGDDDFTPSPIKMYTVIDNTGDDKADAIIALDAEVARVIETKTTAKPQTITLGNNKDDSIFGTLEVSGNGKQVIGDFDITTALNQVFTAWKVASTKPDDEGKTYAVLKTPLKTVTGTVSTYKTVEVDGEDVVSSVKLAGGDELERSGILEGDQVIAYGTEETIKAGVTYTFTLDEAGRFVRISSPSEYSFLYATYADFQYGAMGTGEIEYKVYGIDWNGQNVNDHDLVSMKLVPQPDKDDDGGDGAPEGQALTEDELDKYPNDKAVPPTTLGDGYDVGLTITRKNMANNNVKKGYNTAFMIDAKGNLVQKINDGSEQFVGGDDIKPWTITNKDASNGFAQVETGGKQYMLTSGTVFYVVSGFGINAKVTPYNGLKDLVGSSTGVTIDPNAKHEIWFQTGDDKFDSVETGDNQPITKMILSIDNLDWYSNENLYFLAKETPEGSKLAGADDAEQWELWLNGKKDTYWIDEWVGLEEGEVDEAGGDDEDDGSFPGLFLTLSKSGEESGVTIYKATVLNAKDDPKMTTQDVGGVCNVGLTYTYVLVNNYSKAKIGDDVMNVDGATVADVEFDAGLEEDDRIEIDTLRKLNNAVSTDYTIKVAIVNNGIDVSTIYVVSAEAPAAGAPGAGGGD